MATLTPNAEIGFTITFTMTEDEARALLVLAHTGVGALVNSVSKSRHWYDVKAKEEGLRSLCASAVIHLPSILNRLDRARETLDGVPSKPQ